MSKDSSKPKENIKGPWLKLIEYTFPYKKYVIISIILSFIASILTIIGPNKIQEMVDSISEIFITGVIDWKTITSLAIFLVLIYVVSGVLQMIVTYVLSAISMDTSKKMRTDISRKINRVPLSYFDKSSVGDVLSRISNDTDTVGRSMNYCVSTMVSSFTLLIGSTVMMFYTNWQMALTAVLVSIAGFLTMAFIMSRSQKYFRIQQKNLGEMNGFVEETYSGHDIIKIYGCREGATEEFDKINKELYNSAYKSQFLGGLMVPLMNLVANLGYVSVCVVGMYLMIDSFSVSFGTIFAFLIYVRLFTQPLSQSAQAFLEMQSVAAASERVFEFLDLDEMENEDGKELVLKDVKGNVEFRDVHFGYTPDKEIIRGFTANIRSGQKVAIVGPTGAGKTTLINLLMRFYDLNSGDILIDGISTKDVRRENVHDQFCMVLQDTWIFKGTIKENIRFCKEDVTDEEIVEACKSVGIHYFINSLPDKYDTVLSNTVNISAGQRQQITIARAIVQKAPILILDEATSSIDTRTEKIIQDAMDNLTLGRTSFVIAHRLSTIKNADLIIVMKDGNIVEHGTHNDLLASNGYYAELYNSQFSGQPSC